MNPVETKMNTEINATPAVEEKKKVKVSKPKPVVKIVEPKAEEVKVDEVRMEENVDEALEAQEKIIKEAQEKTTQLRFKKQITEKAPDFLEKIAQRKKRELMRLEEQKLALETQIEEIENEIETIEEVEEEDIGNFLATNYADEVNGFLAVIYPDFNKKPETKPEGAKRKTGVVTKTMKPADRWALIEEGTQFRAKQKDFIRYYKKTADGVVECDQTGTIDENSPVYAGNQEAANAFRTAAGISYSISGWEFLQLYNPETEKAKSLKKWDGDVDYLLW
jgi:hypothetical protein